jgi:hypothetical protein
MRKGELRKEADESEEPLVDITEALHLRSKRTERRQKKRQEKEKASKPLLDLLFGLPYELLPNVFSFLRPSDIFSLLRVNQALRQYILNEQAGITRSILERRYAVLSKCFRRPVLLENVDEDAHPALLSPERQAMLNIHKRPYQHIQSPDPNTLCTCLTCMLSWNNLNLVVDFAHWQRLVEKREPITMIPRGRNPSWNRRLIASHASVVSKALTDSLWYARILECHLSTTIRAIRWHGNNKGNKRKRFRMTKEDAEAEADVFLSRSGPPTMDFPFHRDNYYMLEAYLPNRGWNAEAGEWWYMPANQHEKDVEMVMAWERRRREAIIPAMDAPAVDTTAPIISATDIFATDLQKDS